jgi:hypothetical protein
MAVVLLFKKKISPKTYGSHCVLAVLKLLLKMAEKWSVTVYNRNLSEDISVLWDQNGTQQVVCNGRGGMEV